ncbi:MAG TPA: proton-conducting transporter membrane subunit [Gaiellaceae bacterium]
MHGLVPLVVAIPLLAAAVLVAAGHALPRPSPDVVAIGAAAATTVLCGLLAYGARDHDLVYWFGGWRPVGGVALGIDFDVDLASAAIAGLAALLATASLVFSWRYFDEVGVLFHALVLVFLAAMVGFAISGDLFNIFVFLELMSVVAVALTAYGDEPGPLQGALNFAVVNGIGAFCVLIGIGLVYARTGALNLEQIGRALEHRRPDGLVVVAFALIVCGFLTKAGIVPFHFWLSDAYAVAPAPVCAIFAGVMSDLGLHAVSRVYWSGFAGALGEHQAELRAVLVALGSVTALLGGVMAFLQRDLKRMIAFVTVSQLGVGLVGIGLLTARALGGSTLVLLSGGLVRGAVLLAVGLVISVTGVGDELRGRGVGRQLPISGAVFALGALMLAGLPPSGRSLLDTGAPTGYGWLPVVLTAASILASGALLRAGGRVFLGWGAASDPALGPQHASAEEDEPRQRQRSPILLVPAAVLLVLGVAVSVWPGAGDHAASAAARVTNHAAHAREVLDGRRATSIEVDVGGVDAVSVASGLVSAAGAVGLALLTLRRRRVSDLPGLRVGALKAVHSGVVGDYVAWLVVGLALVGGLFAVLLR